MRGLWTITRKDLLLRLRDRSILLYGIVAPLVLAAVLGMTFSGIEDDIELDLGVVADAERTLAGPFLEQVLPVLREDGLVRSVEEFDDQDAARAAVAAGELTAVVVFGDAGPSGPGDVEVLGNVDSPTGVGITESVVGSYVDQVRGVSLTVQAGLAGGAGDPQQLVAAGREAASAVLVADEPVGIQPVDLTTYMSAAMAVFFLFFAVGLAVTGLLEEQRDRTMARLATAPIPSWAPLGAKALTALIVGIASMAVLAVATTLLLGAEWGDPRGVALLIVAAVLAATGVVGLVASMARTPESATAMLGVVATVLGALGGAFFPLRGVGVLDAVSLVSPHHWFLQGLTRLAGGAPVGDIATSLVVLVGVAAVTGVAAVLRLRTAQEV